MNKLHLEKEKEKDVSKSDVYVELLWANYNPDNFKWP